MMQMTSLTWQCVVEVGMPAILQTITTTEAVSTTVKPKLKRKVAEKKNKVAEITIFRTEDYLGVILLILEPIVSITLLPQQIIPFQKRSENLKR